MSWDRAIFRDWKTHITIIILILLTKFLANAWILQYPGVVLMRALDEQKTPKAAKKVVLVTITPDEYRREFKGTSPLDATKLSNIIDAILYLEPAVLAVDLDTSDEQFRQFAENYGATTSKTKIVWARGVSADFRPAVILGGNEAGAISGVAGFVRDPDWTVRKVNVCVYFQEPLLALPAFHTVAAGAFEQPHPAESCKDHPSPLKIYQFPTMTVTQVKAARSGNNKASILNGKIVVLGSTYQLSDVHPSPAGPSTPGIELVGSAIERQLTAHASGSNEWKEQAFSFAYEYLLGLAIVAIYAFKKLTLAWKLAGSMLIALVLALLPGAILYLWNFWSENPFLVAVGVMLHQMYEGVHGHSSDAHGGEVYETLRIKD